MTSATITVPGPARDQVLAVVRCPTCGHDGLQYLDHKGKPRGAACLCCSSPKASPYGGTCPGALPWHSYTHRGSGADWLLICCTRDGLAQGTVARVDGQTDDEEEQEVVPMAKKEQELKANAEGVDDHGLVWWLGLVDAHGDKASIVAASGMPKDKVGAQLRNLARVGLVRRSGYTLTPDARAILDAAKEKAP